MGSDSTRALFVGEEGALGYVKRGINVDLSPDIGFVHTRAFGYECGFGVRGTRSFPCRSSDANDGSGTFVLSDLSKVSGAVELLYGLGGFVAHRIAL